MKDSRVTELVVACKEIGYQVTRRSHAMASRMGLSPSDYDHLSLLVHDGPKTAGQLATMTGLTTGAITGVIDRLEAVKLVQRQHDKLDRRRIIVAATKRAVKDMQELHKKSDKDFVRSLNNYSAAELTTILLFLDTTTEFLRQQAAQIAKK